MPFYRNFRVFLEVNMTIDLLLVIIAGILLVVGFIGTFVPVLPGAPLAWAGLLVAFFSKLSELTIPTLIITAVVAVLVSVLDNIFPVLMTKKSGGSKVATTGSTVGLIIGLFIGPIGIIVGPFIGALVGELIQTKGDFNTSLKSAWGAFVGFLFGTGLKMASVAVFIIIFIASLIH